MKVLVVTHAPNTFEAAVDLELAEALAAAFRGHGDNVEVVRLPFGRTDDTVRGFAQVRMIDFTLFADLVVCLSTVAAIVQHRRKVTWFDPPVEAAAVLRSAELNDRVMAECAMRYTRSAVGLASLEARNLTGTVLQVPSNADDWRRVVERVIG